MGPNDAIASFGPALRLFGSFGGAGGHGMGLGEGVAGVAGVEMVVESGREAVAVRRGGGGR